VPLYRVRVERTRVLGMLWQALGLDVFCREAIPQRKPPVGDADVAANLALEGERAPQALDAVVSAVVRLREALRSITLPSRARGSTFRGASMSPSCARRRARLSVATSVYVVGLHGLNRVVRDSSLPAFRGPPRPPRATARCCASERPRPPRRCRAEVFLRLLDGRVTTEADGATPGARARSDRERRACRTRSAHYRPTSRHSSCCASGGARPAPASEPGRRGSPSPRPSSQWWSPASWRTDSARRSRRARTVSLDPFACAAGRRDGNASSDVLAKAGPRWPRERRRGNPGRKARLARLGGESGRLRGAFPRGRWPRRERKVPMAAVPGTRTRPQVRLRRRGR
jgi:hypothetical protein